MKTPEEQITKILKDNKLKIDYEIQFPNFDVLPQEIELALTILKKKGMRIVFVLKEAE